MIPAAMGEVTLVDAEVLLAGMLELVNALPDDALRMHHGPDGTVIIYTRIPNVLMDEAMARFEAREQANEQTIDDAREEARP